MLVWYREDVFRKVLVAFGIMLITPLSSAEAAKKSATSDTLVGWSDDGKTFAVIRDRPGSGDSLLVVQDGVVVLQLCELRRSDEQCKAADGVKTVSREITSVSVKRHKYLRDFKLNRVSSKWRKGFTRSFLLRGTHPAKNWKDEDCQQGWKLLRRGDKNAHATESVTTGCLEPKKGYLHPSGKYVLVKQLHNTWANAEDGSWSEDDTTHKFIALKVPVLPAPEETE